MPTVIFRGKLIPHNVCNAYEGDEQAFFDALAREEKTAMYCLIQRIKPTIRFRGQGLTEEDIDDIVEDAVLETILNIQRGIKKWI
jgi:hypothetical protein